MDTDPTFGVFFMARHDVIQEGMHKSRVIASWCVKAYLLGCAACIP
jgi:hypothetical protein